MDEYIVLADEAEMTDFSKIGDVDVILDYVYGPLTVHLLSSLKSTRPVQYIHVGGLSGSMDISLPGSVLRSKNLTIRGSGPGAWSMRDVARTIDQMLEAVKIIPEQPIRVVKLQDIEKAWGEAGDGRLVIVM